MGMEGELLRIGEIAAFFNVSVKTLRVYEKVGILRPVKVDDNNGYRYYSVDQVRQLNVLLELREFGFSLSEIKNLLANGVEKEKYIEALVRKTAAWQEKINIAKYRIDIINDTIKKTTAAKSDPKIYELTDDERARLLSGLACLDKFHDLQTISEAIWL